MKENLKKMFSYYRPYKKAFYTDMFFAFVSAVIALVIPLAVRFITAHVSTKGTQEAFLTIVKVCIGLFVLILLQCYCNYYISNYGHVMGAKMEYDMRAEIFEHLQKLSFHFYDNQKVGQLMSRITTDLFDICELLHHGPENIVISIIKIIGALFIMLTISPELTPAAFAPVIPMLLYAYFYNKKMKRAFRENRNKIADINAQIEDNLSGIRVVKSFANEEIEQQKFKIGNKGFLSAKKNSYRYMGGYQAGLQGFTAAITVVVLLFGGIMLTRGVLSISDLIAFLLYINVFTDPIKTLVDFTEQFQNGYAGFERFTEILAIEPDVSDAPDAVMLADVKGDVSFCDVSFQYEDSEQMVLNHVNLNVSAGEYIALVGSSGAGKSTLCSLIPRFYDTKSGKILFDGKDIRTVHLSSLRSNIGMVQQDVYLSAGTIADNIRYGKPDATMEEVVEAAKNANAHEFIMSFPDGYDTDIGQRGVKLSGGQKQRLSIARVFLKNPPVLIFDEATSALDNESERIVQQSLERLAKNRTTFVIAHRLSTIRNAQRIIVLTDNGIEESGTHEELMHQNGIYKGLYQLQFDSVSM